MTPDEIQNIYAHQSEEFDHKLDSFYQLRSIFTSLIEGIDFVRSVDLYASTASNC